MTVTEIFCKNFNTAFDRSETNDKWPSDYSKPAATGLDSSDTDDRFVSIATDLKTTTPTNIVIDITCMIVNNETKLQKKMNIHYR